MWYAAKDVGDERCKTERKEVCPIGKWNSLSLICEGYDIETRLHLRGMLEKRCGMADDSDLPWTEEYKSNWTY